MKRTYFHAFRFIAAIFIGVLLHSCSYPDRAGVEPQDAAMTIQGSAGSSLRASITVGKTIDESITLFNALPPGHKALVWKDKLEDSKRFFTNLAQISWIDGIKSSVNASTFTQSPPDELLFLKETYLRFSDVETYRIFMVLHDFDQNPDPRRPVAQGTTNPDCYCRWSMGCGMGGGLCESGACNTRAGCGFLLLYDCNGLCDNLPL